ncbi:LPXTG cell wall anchor domain-containing protein [Streptomyces mauvecolor]|uniref:LPXTG cell wall anchor domain-containing protein n=1 Tax=Streptomyces mauvecolor TaxID=58345 RepID=A0ABV9UF16_9ACTN
MSARIAHRLFRPAATAVVVAAVAGTVLLPMSAQAATSDDAQRPLVMTMGTPAPNGPLTRGGAAETFELTVGNPTAKTQAFHPWMLGDAVGASPLQSDDVTFKVEAVDAPATKSFVGHQDGGWQGMFYPSGKDLSAGFDVPANGKLTWKVTIGLGAGYPTNDGDFKLTATSLNGEVAQNHQASHTFKADPQIKAGRLKTWFEKKPGSTMDHPNDRQYLDLHYQATGDGVFSSALTTRLQLSYAGPQVKTPAFFVQALIDGRWQDLKVEYGSVALPTIPKGFGSASGVRTLPLRINLGVKTQIKKVTPITAEADVSLASGNTYPFGGATAQFSLGPIDEGTTTPTTKPSTKPTGTPSAKPAASAAGSAAPVAAAGNANLTTATSATGSLAHTGADSNTGLYAGVAAALVALGGAVAWLGARRRRSASSR